ncbi:hypothetical protein [Kitasatospora sp. NPDC051914]|uniref:TolB family protein n=1 Tax=Kitasatospora sp. NPDC051914 TaxID=3154945 RepID=UPI003423A6F7
MLQTLEDFAITRDGRPYRAADVNYWGVTFTADDNRFYATLATGGRRHLVEGDLAAPTVRTVADNVECPSLSPDGRRIAFEQAVDGDPVKGWRPAVMDLASGAVRVLPEQRSVDDQPAWLDDATVAYALQRPDGVNDVWSVPADGPAAPRPGRRLPGAARLILRRGDPDLRARPARPAAPGVREAAGRRSGAAVPVGQETLTALQAAAAALYSVLPAP